MTPGWILDIFAALMLAVAAVSAARLVEARPWQHGAVVTDTDIAHLLMAIAMAGMLVSSLRTLPDTVWEVIFGVLTAWFCIRVIRDARANGVRALAGGHCAPHLAHSAAMLYMFLALVPSASGGQGMSGMGGSSASGMQSLEVPTVAFVFALVLAGYTIWDLDQISSPARRGMASANVGLAGATLAAVPVPVAITVTEPVPAPLSGGHGVLLRPSMTLACRIAMGATMAFMLLIMI
jgi:hypothetical protein